MQFTVHRTVVRGAEFREEFGVRLEGASLSDIEVEASGSVAPGEEVIIEPTIAISSSTVGVANCVLLITPEQSAGLPDHLTVDVRCRVPSAQVGFTPALRLLLHVEPTCFPS